MLGIVVAAALSPNTGVVQAQTPASYVSVSPNYTPVYVGVALAAIAAIIVGLLLLMRRRRPPPAAAQPPVQAWQGGPSGPGGAAAPPAPAPPPPPAAAPAYLETPEDVGHAPPAVPVTKGGAAAAGAGAGAAAGEAEPDIDSLMAELDKISGEILKRAPKKGAQKPPAEPGEEEQNP